MSYAFTYHVPVDAEIYARIKEGRRPQRPDGLIAHLAWRTDTGLRYVDVWQSKDEYEAFAEHRLHPVVQPLLQEMVGLCRPSLPPPCSMSSTPGPTGILTDPPVASRPGTAHAFRGRPSI
jgi:hypothetical protein